MEPANEKVRITVLETSDLHGSILPIHYANNQPRDVGLAKIAAMLRRERERADRAGDLVIAIDNGDLIQGTPLAYHHARIDNSPINPMVLVLNKLGYAAAVIGNHEFNYGMNVLNKAVAESAFPWLSANIVKAGTKEPYFGKPYVMFHHRGVKLAVLGLTTPYIPNWENPDHIAGLEFLNAVETAQSWVARLRKEEGADAVIVSYHGGFERDPDTGEPSETQTGENEGYRLCTEVEGIDVLMTGHQHREIAGKTINGVTIAQPGHLGQCAAVIRLAFERREGKWAVAEKASELLSVEGVEPEQDVLDSVKSYEEAAQQWLDTPIGAISGDMTVRDPMRLRMEDNALIEFINKVQMETAGARISNTALFSDDAPGFPEKVTMRHIVSNYIYPNTLKVIRISGRDMREALEKSATYFTLDEEGHVRVSPKFAVPKPQHYNYDMWEGIEYVLDISRPEGERVVKLTIGGETVDPDGQYEAAMNHYRAGGGGDYTMFQGKPVVKDIPTDISELLANYIMERKTVKATVNGNWRVVTSGGDL